MNMKSKKHFTIGDVISAIFQVWGVGRAEKMVRLAVKTHMVVPREPAHFLPKQRPG
jgi:hypothetical protein